MIDLSLTTGLKIMLQCVANMLETAKIRESIKPTAYSTTLQKSPNSVRAGEFLGIWPVMSDTKGFSTELNSLVNEVATTEGWGPAELGVEFSNTKIGTFDG